MSWVANPRSRLFETDRVEMALEQIMLNQGLPAQRKREADTNTTPRIELDLEPTGMTGNRYALNNGGLSQFQPFNVWKFNLGVAIVTNRQTNDADHLPLTGIARWELQMARLQQTFTAAICPTHCMIEIREEGCEASVNDGHGNDITTIRFIGMFGIRDSAWANG